jgi:uncharacterized protein with ParB-like and HNH nuclease domain
MKADTLDLTQMFAKNVQYQVPLFQRPYVWNRDDHWEPLWSDVLSLMDDHRDGDHHEHFMGAVVLEQVPTPTARVDKRHVIDGQQRLTTLQLLLAATRDEAEARALDGHVGFLSSMVENPSFAIQEPDDKWKVLPTRADQLGFIAALTLDRQNTRLEQGHDYFGEVIREWLAEFPPETHEAEFERLVEILTRALKLVVIDLDGGDQAQVIFETLNARGTPLEAADLVKNALFARARKEGHDLEKLHDEVWSRFLDDYWREEVRQGRLFRSRIDVFATHYLTMKTGREIKSSQLFSRFREWMGASSDDARSLMEDLERHGGIFAGFGEAAGSESERRFFANLSLMDTSTLYPYLLWLYGNDVISAEDRQEILDALESFLVRRMLLRLTPKNYNRLFLSLLSRSSGEPSDAKRLAIDFLSESDADTSRWPTDDEVIRRLGELKLYGNIRRDRLQMVLTTLSDRYFSSKLQEPIRVTGDLTVEHLMPQRWETHWDADGTVEMRDDRNFLVHTIGNLTVITQSLNSMLSNGPWPDKRSAILSHSALPINRQLPEIWDDDAIRERSKSLAKAVVEAWPGPSNMKPGDATPSITGGLPQDPVMSDAGTSSVDRRDLLSGGPLPANAAGRTQRITSFDIEAGQIRVPVDQKHLFPDEKSEIDVVLRERSFHAKWNSRFDPSGERSGVIRIPKADLEALVVPDEVLAISVEDGVWHLR